MQKYYRDAFSNFGPIESMKHKPYMRVSRCVINGTTDDSSTERSHILSDKGMVVDEQSEYEFHVDVLPPTRITRLQYQGNVLSIHGKTDNNLDAFVVGELYSVYSEYECCSFVVKVGKGNRNVSVRPWIKTLMATERFDDLMRLPDRLKLSEPDFRLVLPTGEALPTHRCVLVASSAFFEARLSWAPDKHELRDCYKLEEDAFSLNAWAAALAFMYDTEIHTHDVRELQDLLKLGAQYMVRDLPTCVARMLHAFVNEAQPHNVTGFAVPLLQLADLYKDSDNEILKIDMNSLKNDCLSFIRMHACTLIMEPDFVASYAEYLRNASEPPRKRQFLGH